MFSQIHGLPLHPLAVHAAVVFVPLAALLGILFVIPRTRAWARIPFVVVTVGGLLSVFVARQSGLAFFKALHIDQQPAPIPELIAKHQHRANWLLIFMLVFAVIAVAAYYLSRDTEHFTGTLMVSVSAVVVVAALVVAVQTYLVGDIGSKALWNPDGTRNYGAPSVTQHLAPTR
jgi:uncharacterized membrane protein